MEQEKKLNERLLSEFKRPTKNSISRDKGEERAIRLMKKFLKRLADPKKRWEAHTYLLHRILFSASRDTKAFYRYLAYYLLDLVNKLQSNLDQEKLQESIDYNLRFLNDDYKK